MQSHTWRRQHEVLARGDKVWLTNEHQRSGLRDDGEAVLDRLIAMASGELESPQ
jgi:hypothetical protein